MAEKTVLKRLLSRYGILSVEMRNAVKEDDEADMNLDNVIENEAPAQTQEKEKKPKKEKEKIVDAEVIEQTQTEPEEDDPYK